MVSYDDDGIGPTTLMAHNACAWPLKCRVHYFGGRRHIRHSGRIMCPIYGRDLVGKYEMWGR